MVRFLVLASVAAALLVRPALSAPCLAQTADDGALRLTRSVKGRELISTETPPVRLRFDRAFRYVGGQVFILYGVARAEQHFFVDADKQGRIRRLYWVQFEGYLPSNTHTYQYPVARTVTLGGREFIADAYPRNLKAQPGRPDSDGARARAFLASKGYRMASDEVLSQRLVHLVDAAKRSELMIIYTEDLTPLGLHASDFEPGGRAAPEQDRIFKGLLERATRGLRVESLPAR